MKYFNVFFFGSMLLLTSNAYSDTQGRITSVKIEKVSCSSSTDGFTGTIEFVGDLIKSEMDSLTTWVLENRFTSQLNSEKLCEFLRNSLGSEVKLILSGANPSADNTYGYDVLGALNSSAGVIFND